MFHRLTWRLIAIATTVAYTLKLTPYYWDPKTRQIKISNSKWDRVLWGVVRCIIWLHQVLLIVAMARTTGKDIKIVDLGLRLVYIIGSMFPSAIEVVMSWKGTEIVHMFNLNLRYWETLKQIYVRDDAPPRRNGSESYLIALVVLCVLQPTSALAFYFRKPDSPMFIASLFNPRAQPKSILILLGLPEYLFFLMTWAAITFISSIFIPFVYSLHFWLHEIRPGISSVYTRDALRLPADSLLTYRCLQISIDYFNHGIRDYFAIANTISSVMSIMCNYLLIRHHDQTSKAGVIALMNIMATCSTYIFMSHYIMGGCTKASTKFLSAWRRREALSTSDRKLMLKYVKSYPILKVKIHEFGSFQKFGAPRGVGRIITITVKVLATFGKKKKHH